MGMFARRNRKASPSSSDRTLETYPTHNAWPIRIFTAICYTLSLVFLILVCIGNINKKAVIRSTYFLKIGLANLIPESIPNAVFINSVAQSIGLHDFYQVGVWGFCEGYNGQGITHCSSPKMLYWFNPVEIILNELLAGASISLPSEVISTLRIVKTVSQWMFASFIVGTCLTFLSIFLVPMAFSSHPRWSHKARRVFLRSFPITVLTFLAALFTIGASIIATVMFIIFRNTFKGAADFNIEANLGTPMLAFMWIASGFNLLGFLMQIGLCCGICCCNGRRKQRKDITAKSQPTKKEAASGSATKRFAFKRNSRV